MDQKKGGIIIHYINIILDFGIALFFTPFLLQSLGDAEYGLYRIIQSFAGQLSILSFGIATLVARNIVRYDTLGQIKEKENFLATAGITTGLLALLVVIVGAVLSLSLDTLFDRTLSAAELNLAKELYWLLVANVAVTVITDMAVGLLIGHEKFLIRNGMTTIRQFARVLVLIILLKLDCGALAIVGTDLVLSVLLSLLQFFYGFGVLKERVHFYYLDKEELKTSIIFSIAIFLQAIVNQVNQNLDSVILGSMTTTETVAMYSIALSLFTMFNSITMVFGTVFVPQATRMITKGATSDELTELVVRPGRFAVMIGNLIITGFILFGREFIRFWVGDSYMQAYFITIVLMVPGMLPLMQNVTNAILDAMMKRLGRSLILIAMAGLNIIISVFLVKRIGYLGAAIGTATSYVVGYLVFNNLYLFKTTNINITQMYKGLLSKNISVSCICLLLCLPMMLLKSRSVFMLIGKIVFYSIIYLLAMYRFGMKEYERKAFLEVIRKLPILRSVLK